MGQTGCVLLRRCLNISQGASGVGVITPEAGDAALDKDLLS